MAASVANGPQRAPAVNGGKESGSLIKQRRNTLALFVGVALLCRFALADAYDPPGTYYNTATSTGATLKQQLHNIIDGQTNRSYDQLRSDLQITDADPNDPSKL